MMTTTTEAIIMNQNAYEARVEQLEAEGITRSDAQGIADAEQINAERDYLANRFESMEEAKDRAEELTESTGEQHVAYQTGYVVAPFMAARMPQVGDDVSMAFNGDAYPCGEIVRISPTYSTITTSHGVRFTRVGPNAWKRGGKRGAFSLITGTIRKWNPEF
jgi:hypothetical protein